jgi:hypothetical protein
MEWDSCKKSHQGGNASMMKLNSGNTARKKKYVIVVWIKITTDQIKVMNNILIIGLHNIIYYVSLSGNMD